MEKQARNSIALLETDDGFPPESSTPPRFESAPRDDDRRPDADPAHQRMQSPDRQEKKEASGEAVWKYTMKKLVSTNSDEAVYYAEWSEPSKLMPFPRATAGVTFTIGRQGRISYQFENHRLVHSHDFPVINTVSDAVFEDELEKSLAAAPEIVNKTYSDNFATTGGDTNPFSMAAKQTANQNKELDQIELSKLKHNFITKSTLGVPSKRIVDIINAKLRVSDKIASGALLASERVPGFEKGSDQGDEDLSGMGIVDMDGITPPTAYTAEDLLSRSGIERFRDPLEEDSDCDEENLNNPEVILRR